MKLDDNNELIIKKYNHVNFIYDILVSFWRRRILRKITRSFPLGLTSWLDSLGMEIMFLSRHASAAYLESFPFRLLNDDVHTTKS